jgi:hypothetical protein
MYCDVLRRPALLQAGDGAGGERSALAEQSAHRQLEVSTREAMQIQLGKQLTDLSGPSLEEWQHAADKGLLRVAHPRTSDADGADAGGEPPFLAIAVARARGAAWLPALGFRATEKGVNLLFQKALQHSLDRLPREVFQLFIRISKGRR